MVVKKLDGYYKKVDKFGVAVGAWAVQKEPGIARCKDCDTEIKFENAGLTKLHQHSEGKKHRDKIKDNQNQSTLSTFVGQFSAEALGQIKAKEAARKLEITLARAFSRHQMSPSHLGCIVDIFKQSATDSEILKHVSLSETKGAYTILAIAKTYHQETVQLMKESDALSIGFDESEMNKREEMEIVVKI